MEDTAIETQQPVASVASQETQEPVREAQPTEPPTPDARALQAELTDLRSALSLRDAELQSVRRQLASATARYRVALLNAAPEVPEELVTGATPEELETSLARGRQMVERIRSRIEAQLAEQRVPTGAPVRSGVDVAGMSPGEKIAYALAQRERG